MLFQSQENPVMTNVSVGKGDPLREMLVFHGDYFPEYRVDETDTLPHAHLCSCCHAHGSIH